MSPHITAEANILTTLKKLTQLKSMVVAFSKGSAGCGKGEEGSRRLCHPSGVMPSGKIRKYSILGAAERLPSHVKPKQIGLWDQLGQRF